MKKASDYRDGTYENYLAYHHNKKVTSLKDIEINGHLAQQIDFYKAEHPDGTVRYYIGIVFRQTSLYKDAKGFHGRPIWLEDRYLVTKEEGNQIYLQAKNTGEYIDTEITTY